MRHETRMHESEWTRRDVLAAGSVAFLGISGRERGLRQHILSRVGQERRCIFLLLVGGPGQTDTFDPKPEAPAEYRGPFRTIRTNVSGVQVSELLPRTARQADKFAIVRSVYHDAPAVHDVGHQLVQTGRWTAESPGYPHAGCASAYLRSRSEQDLPAHVVLPGPIAATGGYMPHGQSAGPLGSQYETVFASPDAHAVDASLPRHVGAAIDLAHEPANLRAAYGETRFGRSCLAARRLVERGCRFVTVNMHQRLVGESTWDNHAGFDGVRACGVTFDAAYSTLLADLHARGLLDSTLVVATGEFGRTPRINRSGGRDHWTQCCSALFAGGGVKGGQIIGASDALGAYPKDRPTHAAEIVATVYHSLGIPLEGELPAAEGERMTLLDQSVRAIRELF